jgi:hypothetical protein
MTLASRQSPIHVVSMKRRRTSSHATHLHVTINPVFIARARQLRPALDAGGSAAGGPATIGPRVLQYQRSDARGSRAGEPRAVAAGSGLTSGAPRSLLQIAPFADLERTTAADRSAPPLRRVIDDVVTRISRGHQRIETTVGSSRVIKEHADIAAQVAHALATESVAAGTHASQALGERSLPAGSAALGTPPIDFEDLTDQIVTRLDNRMTAHRERFGRTP